MSTQKDVSEITSGVSEIITADGLKKKLKNGEKLRIKLGVDATSADLHLGHAVCLLKLKEFQELGHKVIFLIGDFTTKIGDPSGRNSTRPVLTDEEIKANAKSYFTQVGKILDIDKCEIRYNSEWYRKLNFADLLKIASFVTVTQVMYRDDFQKRLYDKMEIGFHETLYPIMQGYDSVVLKSDVEIGGLDQKLNMLMGRSMQKKFGQLPQDVITMPLLVGIDGTKKMSKSYGNYIGISESPYSQYSKIMSIPDRLITQYFELAARVSGKELEKISKQVKEGKECRELKAQLARSIVSIYSGASEASLAEEEFKRVFQRHEMPLTMPEVVFNKSKNDKLVNILADLCLASSKSEARRLVSQKAVKVDRAVIDDQDAQINLHNGMVIQVGKRKFVRIKIG